MEHGVSMAFLQIKNSHFGLCIILFLLICGDFTISYDRNILHQMNRTAFKGETVVFHCNGTLSGLKDISWHKDRNVLYNSSPINNRTVLNYTSSRMQVDPQNPRKLQISDVQLSDAGLYSCFPLNMLWILTIEDQKERNEMWELFIRKIVLIVTGAVAVGVIIFCIVYFSRKCKSKEAHEQRSPMDESQPHERRIKRHRNQYFEKVNSVYGQLSI